MAVTGYNPQSYKSVSSGRDNSWGSLAQAGATNGLAGVVEQGLTNVARMFIETGNREQDRAALDNGYQLGEKAAADAFAAGSALKLRDDNGIESQAFNERALDVYMGRLGNSLNERMDTLAHENRHDPEGFKAAIEAIKPDILGRLPENQRENVAQNIEAQATRKFVSIRNQVEQQAVASYLARLNLDVEKGISDLELNTEDPGAFLKSSADRKAKLMADVPDPLREEVSLRIDTRVEEGRRRLTKAYQGKLEEAANADLFTQADTSGRKADQAWRAGDYATAQTAEAEYMAAVAARTDLTPTRKAAIATERNEDRLRQIALGDFDRFHTGDPERAEQFISDFRDEDHDLAPDTKARIANEMESMASDIAAARRRSISELRAQAGVAVDAVSKGRTFGGWDDLIARAADLGDGETVARLTDARAIMADASDFAKLPPARMAARLDELRANVKTDTDNARLDVLEKVATGSVKDLAKDPIKYGVEHGISNLAPLDMSDPVKMVADRVNAAMNFSERMGVPVDTALTSEEAELITSELDAMTTIDRAAMLGKMLDGAGSRPDLILSAVAKKRPEYAHAGAVFAKAPKTAADILAGVEIAQTNKQFAPSPAKWKEGYSATIPAGAMDGIDWETRAGIESTIRALYTKFAADANDTSGEVDGDALEQAVNEVTGGFVQYDADNTGTVDSYQTVAPIRGMSSDAFTDLIDGLTDADLPELPHSKDGEAISISDARRMGQLKFIGNGRYLMEFGGGQIALNASGTAPYVLDLAAIAGGE